MNNSATGCRDHRCHGGALFVGRACNLQTENSTFVNNTSELGGGVATLFQGILFDNQNLFIGNSANSLGGVISAYDRSLITIQSSMYQSTAIKAALLVILFGRRSYLY